MKKQLCDCKSRCNPFLEPTSSKQCGYSSLLGSVSFWSSYVSFRVYCFATYPLSATWLMHFVFGSSLWKGNFHFQLRRVIFGGTAHHVIVVIICLHVFLHFSNFFTDLADLLHFVYSDICLISQASFFLRIISKLGFPPATTHHIAKHSYSFIIWACFEDTVNTNQI